jgi:hypothetical protein
MKTQLLAISVLFLACGTSTPRSSTSVDSGIVEDSGSPSDAGEEEVDAAPPPIPCYINGDCHPGDVCKDNGFCGAPSDLNCSKGYTAVSVLEYALESSDAGECDYITYSTPAQVCLGESGNRRTSPGTCPANNIFAKCDMPPGNCYSCTNCHGLIIWYTDVASSISALQLSCVSCDGVFTPVGCSTLGCSCLTNSTCESGRCVKGVCE